MPIATLQPINSARKIQACGHARVPAGPKRTTPNKAVPMIDRTIILRSMIVSPA
jgi:hypothetical protein